MSDQLFSTLISMCVGFIAGLITVRVSTQTQLVISEKARIQQMKLAALEKRLAKHQEAYALFYELFWDMDNADKALKARVSESLCVGQKLRE